jgi:hypothetical protein
MMSDIKKHVLVYEQALQKKQLKRMYDQQQLQKKTATNWADFEDDSEEEEYYQNGWAEDAHDCFFELDDDDVEHGQSVVPTAPKRRNNLPQLTIQIPPRPPSFMSSSSSSVVTVTPSKVPQTWPRFMSNIYPD